jgi:hypothetical protein
LKPPGERARPIFAHRKLDHLKHGEHHEHVFDSDSRKRALRAPFPLLVQAGTRLHFPCDAAGHVDLDALSTGERDSYFYARSTIGCEFAMPAVQTSDRH